MSISRRGRDTMSNCYFFNSDSDLGLSFIFDKSESELGLKLVY